MMKTTPDMLVSGTAILWSVLVPFLPDTFFSLLDNVVGVLVLLILALVALPQGPVPGVLVLVAVALTFVERNRRKVATKLMRTDVPSLAKQLESAPPMSDQEVHPQWDVTHEDETKFFPEQEQTDAFEPVAASINEKTAIPTIGTNTGTDSATRFFINQHLAKTDLE
jgi:hypothetical protein